MTRTEFRAWISEHYNLPDDNCSLAPDLLENLLDWATNLRTLEQRDFLRKIFPMFPEEILAQVEL